MLCLASVMPVAEKNILLTVVEREAAWWGWIIVDFRDGGCLGSKDRTLCFCDVHKDKRVNTHTQSSIDTLQANAHKPAHIPETRGCGSFTCITNF